MTASHYILRSVLHYRWAYLGVLAGAVLGATVLLGALFAGDSVKASLRRIAENRIGRATHALTAGDRFFREALAAELAAAARIRTAPLLLARGTAGHATTRATANQVQLVGVTDAFWTFAPAPTTHSLDPAITAVVINDTLAHRLSVAVGDTLIVRLQKPGIVAGSAPVAGAESSLQSLRCTVAAIATDAAFGRFGLETTQVPAPSVFLPLARLQALLERPARANLILIDRGAAAAAVDLEKSVARTVQLADYGLSLKWLEKAATFELSSDRVFIDPALADALTRAVPAAQPVLSYLVNEFRAGDRTTPYSIAAATTPAAAPFLPPNLGARDIVLNDWLARDLSARPGDEVRLTFFQSDAAGALVETSESFRVHSIVPLQGLAADSAWMPNFPGMSDAKTTSDWDPGLPLKLERIRPPDEKYWDEFRGAPKAYLPLAAGRALWSTRWGTATALRIPFERAREAELTATLLGALRPAMNQVVIRDLRAGALEGAHATVDFGGLFIGMSFFLILAALGLVAMLFQLSLLQRNREDALLAAVGLHAKKLTRWRLAEGGTILLVGCAIGLPVAALYTRGILRFLESIWAGQGAGAQFVFAASPFSLTLGCALFLLLSVLGLRFALRQQTRRALSIRLAAHTEETTPPARIRRSSLIIAGVAVVIGLAAFGASGRVMPAQGAFYLAGFAFLAAGIAACRAWLSRANTTDREAPLNAAYLGGLNLRARRSRNLTVVGLIAGAVFMVLSVSSFRKHVGSDWLERDSGTGGFAFLAETTAPLNLARDGRPGRFEAFEKHAADLGAIVPLRAGVGDNANCFNLNTTAQPKLLAVDSATLAARAAFPLAAPGWTALRSPNPDNALPAFVDETTLMWALKRKIGDVLAYTDEQGRTFDVRIAGTIRDSIFQGYLIVDEQLFLKKYPAHAGYSLFLVDAKSPADLPALRGRLETSLADAGGRVELTRDVLAAFHQIENTYIAIFNVLGSLGVVLGSLGLAIVVARSLRERHGEFAVMTAIGIPRAVLGRMVFSEYGRLVLWGLAIGAVASLIAIWPSLTTLPALPAALLAGGLLVGIVALNLVSGWLVFHWSLRGLRPGMEQAA